MTLKNKFHQLLLCVFTCSFFLSCQKDLDYVKVDFQLPDFTTKVNSSVSGFVTDENNAAVLNAAVNVGGTPVTTDKYGYFEVKNVQVVKNAAVVTVTMPGYFKGIKTYIAENNKAAFFRIKLIPKTNVGTIDAAAGGNVTLSNGLVVALPSNAVIKVSDNSPYTGTINVAAHWIDPTAADLNQVMPGDLRGTATDGSLKTLTTYGMAAVELTGGSGELLQIATGKKATLTLTIPASIMATAPATIPLWSFDEAKGLWKQEGTATKTGNTYVGEVSHFSFWNCDLPADYVQFDCTLKDASGNPLPYMAVEIRVTGTNNYRYGWTDAAGYVNGAIPDNADLTLTVYPLYCGNVIYTQNFSTTNVNVSLGDITINAGSQLATITGTVTDCANNPVTDGYIMLKYQNWYYRYALVNDGTFTIENYVLCSGPEDVTLIAEDNVGLQQSPALTTTVHSGANAVGNLQACGLSVQEFITYTIDGGSPIEISSPNDTLYHDFNAGANINYVSGHSSGSPSPHNVMFAFDNTSIGAGSVQNLVSFSSSEINAQLSVVIPATVNITEYGAVGEFIAGDFTISVLNTGPPAVTYNIVCGFRVRRIF